MSKLIANIKREPVRWFTVVSGLVPLATTGLIIFNWWHPQVEQLAFVNGLPAAVAIVFGVTVVRGAVTPNEKLPDSVVDKAAQR